MVLRPDDLRTREQGRKPVDRPDIALIKCGALGRRLARELAGLAQHLGQQRHRPEVARRGLVDELPGRDTLLGHVASLAAFVDFDDAEPP